MIRTTKNDWLNQALADNGLIVSGHKSFATQLNLDPDTHHCALRFVHKSDTLLFFLTIETPSIATFSIFLLNTLLIDKLKDLFGDSFFILIFDETDSFLLSRDKQLTFKKISSQGLEEYFGGIDKNLVQNKGTYKGINKSTNDSFQIWTRTHLTYKCVVNDIDALLLGTKNIIYELKRVEEDLKEWRPYLDDISNYASFLSIATRYKLGKRVVAYNEGQSDWVAVHVDLSLGADRSYITGRFVVMPPEFIYKETIGLIYKSERRRKHNY